MSFNYSGLQAVAMNQILDKGQSALLKRSTTTYNPATGENVQVTTNTAINVVKDNFAKSEVDGTIIQTSDIKLLIDGSVEVFADDVIEISGVDYAVVNVDKIEPGDTLVYQEVQVRK